MANTGAKLSSFPEVNDIQTGDMFPLLSGGNTNAKIDYATLANAIIADETARAKAAEAANAKAVTDEATARKNAVNAVQNNLDNETNARTSADTLINTRIDEIIAPSGQAPSAAEVQDIRVKADGTSATTAGNAVREQFTELKNDLSHCVTFENWVAMTLDVTNGKVRDNTTFAEKTASGFSTALVPVTAGKEYKITFWTNSNNYAPAWWSDSALIKVIPQASVEGGTIVTAPTGATQLILNGRNGVADISAYANAQSPESKALFAEIGQLKPKMGVAVTSTEVQVYQHGLVSGYDIMTLYNHKAMNNLLDIYGWYKVPNNSDEVYVANNPSTRIAILKGPTDFIQPFMIWAVNNGNGDFTDPTVRKITGGWHGYNSKTSGDYTATARTTSIKVTCDGREVNTDEADTGDTVIIEITNRIQASNTEKQDGTGREVLEAKYIITYHSGYKRIDIACTLKALEEININRMYGIALYRSGTDYECRAIGSRDHRGAFTFADSINFDEYTKGIIAHCPNGDIEMGLDQLIDLGSGYANENGKGASCGSSKAYMVMIFDNTFTATNGFNMKAGDEASWLGYYKAM